MTAKHAGAAPGVIRSVAGGMADALLFPNVAAAIVAYLPCGSCSIICPIACISSVEGVDRGDASGGRAVASRALGKLKQGAIFDGLVVLFPRRRDAAVASATEDILDKARFVCTEWGRAAVRVRT